MDELLQTQAPHNIDAERAVLGALLTNCKLLDKLPGSLTAADFYISLHGEIFKTIVALHNTGEPVDPVIVRDKIICDSLAATEANAYIAGLATAAPVIGNLNIYTAIVREKSVLRNVQGGALHAARLAAEGATLDEISAALYKVYEAAETDSTTGVLSMTDASLALYRELNERRKAGGGITGLPSGFTGLDEILGGLRPGNMLVLGARPGMGKTACVLNMAVHTASKSMGTVLFFSLEMNAVELCERVYADRAGINLNAIRSAVLTGDEWRKLADTSKAINGLHLRIVEDAALTMPQIVTLCRREKPSLVIIDHLGLVRPDGKQRDRRETMDALSRAVKCLAKDMHIPVLTLVQLNRAVMGRTNKTPVLSDLRESGAIEQDADAVLFIDRPAYYDPGADKTTASLVIAKNRHGQTGAVPLLWYGAKQRFMDDWTKGGDGSEIEPLPGYGEEAEAET